MSNIPDKAKISLWRRLSKSGSGSCCCCGVRIVSEEPEDAQRDQKDSPTERAGQTENETPKTN